MSDSKTKFLAFLFSGLFVISLGAPRLFYPAVVKTSVVRIAKPSNPNDMNLVTGIPSMLALKSKATPEFAIIGKGSKIDYGAGAYYLAVIKDHEPRLISDEKIAGENSKVFRIIDDSFGEIYFAVGESGNLYGFKTAEFDGRTAELLTKVNPTLYSRINNQEYFSEVINPESDVLASIDLKSPSQAELKANWAPKEDIQLVYGEAIAKLTNESKYKFQNHLRTSGQMAYNQTVSVKIKTNS